MKPAKNDCGDDRRHPPREVQCEATIKTADRRGRLRAGAALIARGEFSIVIAGLGVALEPALGPLSAAYVLFTAILGPLAARLAK